VGLRLQPAPPDFGVRFQRRDLAQAPVVRAHHDCVVHTAYATTLAENGVTVAITEHLLAALLGVGVDNVLVELDGSEIPIFDGSASHFVNLIRKAGIRQQPALRRHLKVTRPFALHDGDSYVSISPGDSLKVSYTIDFPHPLVGRQTTVWHLDAFSFARDIAAARTFGFLKDLKRMQENGGLRGGSLENGIVFDERGMLNGGGFRYPDECVRHKVLDLLGDMALAGVHLLGHVEARKAGHTLHHRFLQELIRQPKHYELMDSARPVLGIPHARFVKQPLVHLPWRYDFPPL
jgi:UDP-3-O-[3-hydroxymyristoyl] N-acetylglucosamine deacetylase